MLLKGPAVTSISLALAALVANAVPVRFSPRQDAVTGPVKWDNYTIFVNNERLFLFSGEFHYYRLPSPGLWLDIMEKFKALDYNGASIYFNWGYHSPKKGVYDFQGVRDIQKAFDAAKQVGIHVISRPGPYINAEVDCGGFPGWLATMKSMARVNTTEYYENWHEWLTAVDKYLVPNQITEGGPIILNQIENEYADNIDPAYMQAVINKFAADGMVVPSTFNDPWAGGHFASGEGSVDIYGWDSYPAGFDCSHPDIWPSNTSTWWRAFHEQTNPSQPMALYEFQGGAFDPWGGPGYEACRKMVDERFAKVYYKNNYAQGARIQNLYMTYGGTSWGGLAKPTVYTSYDYGAPISEPGLMTPKGLETKLQGTFLHTVKPFLTTEHFWPKYTNGPTILIDGLKDIYTSTQFYIAQHSNSNSTDLDEFYINIETRDGNFTIPRSKDSKLVLNGRDAKVLVADYDFNSQHLMYSTSEIFTHQDMGSFDVIVVYAYEDEDGEFALKVSNGDAKVHSTDESVVSSTEDGILQINYKHPNGTTAISVTSTGGQGKDLLLLVSGYSSATKWTAPIVSSDNQRVLIHGPYIVRSAAISGSTLSFRGDIDRTTDIEVVAPSNITSFTWNGKQVHLEKTAYGTWNGTLDFGKPDVEYTDLSKAQWKYSPASPESEPDFDDSDWVTADHLDTNSITPPETLPILYADDYGFHTGCIWLRGTFNGSSEITGFNLTAFSGAASAWVAWLNGKYLGGFDIGNQAFTDLNGTLKTDGEKNVISLLLWTTGHEDDWNVNDLYKSARGFTQAELLGIGNAMIWSIQWKIQGNLGGEDLADPVRGPYNEGGLFGERMGWHLPDFPDSDWETASVPETKNRTGVSWYRTTFEVHVPKGYDAPMCLRFEDDSKTRYRALVFVNGWQLGRYANDLGPQTQFYLPEGILNTNGKNTLAVAVIAIDEAAQLGKVVLEPYAILESAKPQVDLVESPGYSKRN